MLNRVINWWKSLFKQNTDRKQAFEMTIGQAIDILSSDLSMERTTLEQISSIHYANQIYKLIMNSNDILFIVLDQIPKLTVLASSNSWLSQLGWSLNDLKKHNLFGLVHPDDLRITSEVYRSIESANTGSIFYNRYKCSGPQEYSFYEDEENWVWLAWIIIPQYSNTDRYRVAIATIVPNNTDRFNRLQNELKEKRHIETDSNK